MRDRHWEQCGQEGQKTISFPQSPDDDEIQPLLFDLVRADKVEVFKTLLPRFRICPWEVQRALLLLAAGSGSTAMVELFDYKPNLSYRRPSALVAALEGNNIETFEHLLSVSQVGNFSSILPEILKSKSEEFLRDWEIYVDAEYELWYDTSRLTSPSVPFGDRYTRRDILKAAKGVSENEKFILLLWEKLNLAKSLTPVHLGDALGNVAATCCSTKMAKYLIDAGAPVNHRRSSRYLTPLHRAVTHNTSEAAGLVKFLLSMGADPAAFATSTPGNGSKIRRIKDEKGAKGISKWLGVSWDDLVQNTEEQ